MLGFYGFTKFKKEDDMIEFLLYILICIHFLFFVYHIAIVLKLVSYKMVWGGRLESDEQMYLFETVSIFILNLFTIVLLAKGNYLSISLPQQAITLSLWGMSTLYLLNTVGNLKSKSRIEQVIFAPLTLMILILLLIILLTPEG